MDHAPTVTRLRGTFGGGDFPVIPAVVQIIDFSIPKGHHLIDGKLYRCVTDPKELESIRYPDGSRPTASALVEVNGHS